MWAKSGWPVTGHRLVNSGAVNRARYRVSASGFCYRSSTAVSGLVGAAVIWPS